MEKLAKSKNKFLKLLPKAASAVTFHNPPFSPTTTNKPRAHAGKGFSGPAISIIPADARRKHSKNLGLEAQEPTSPKVSCMGQIKHKKKIIANKKEKHVSLPKGFKPVMSPKKKASTAHAKPPGRRSDASAEKSTLPDRAPTLSQMKQFASCRDSLTGFDHDRDYYCYSDEESEGDEREVIIPFSAPIMVGGGRGGVALEPRKEINLWKRRTMAQPSPLQVNTLLVRSC